MFTQDAKRFILLSSDPHRHDDVAVLVILALGGTQLAGGLGVFEFKLDIAAADRL